MTEPTPPIELTGSASRWGEPAPLPPALLSELLAGPLSGEGSDTEGVLTDERVVAEHSRDWWPLALHWSLRGEVPRRGAAVVRPRSTAEVAAVAAACHRHAVALTVAGGRSGVCGGVVPLHGGVVLDLTALAGVTAIDTTSMTVTARAGTFGPDLETAARAAGLTVGHWPQSVDISTVGGWIACRGAGQYSTRYGKIEDIVVGLEVVLADGRVVRTGGTPRAAVGPDLTQLFVGSEGTLGIITAATLRAHPAPPATHCAAYRFASFAAGIDACRQVLRRGATPAVLRLYDEAETARGHGGDGTYAVLLVLDEGDPVIVEATMRVVAEVCAATGGTEADATLVDAWLTHRNDTSALQALTRRGLVVDTMEIAAPWVALPTIFERARGALLAVPHALAATCHLSHSYSDGACLYFTFAAAPPPEQVEATYVALWDAGQHAVLAAGGNLSHHHGVGLNRARFVRTALGEGLDVLAAVKAALDPQGILNPGKLGLPTPAATAVWPA